MSQSPIYFRAPALNTFLESSRKNLCQSICGCLLQIGLHLSHLNNYINLIPLSKLEGCWVCPLSLPFCHSPTNLLFIVTCSVQVPILVSFSSFCTLHLQSIQIFQVMVVLHEIIIGNIDMLMSKLGTIYFVLVSKGHSIMYKHMNHLNTFLVCLFKIRLKQIFFKSHK